MKKRKNNNFNEEIMQLRKPRRTDKQKAEICEAYKSGMLIKDIEKKFKISSATIYRYISSVEEKQLSLDEFIAKRG